MTSRMTGCGDGLSSRPNPLPYVTPNAPRHTRNDCRVNPLPPRYTLDHYNDERRINEPRVRGNPLLRGKMPLFSLPPQVLWNDGNNSVYVSLRETGMGIAATYNWL